MEKVDLSILPDWQRERVWAPLQAWYNKTIDEISDDMRYKKAMSEQFVFFRDVMNSDIFYKRLASLEAVSTHTSKSVKLPVYKAVLDDGTTIIARCNFHDWKVSVWSMSELEFPLSLFNMDSQGNCLHQYYEGFKEEWILDNYKNNKKEFTVELNPGEKYIWTFFYLLNEQLSCDEGASDDPGTEVAELMGR